MKFFSLFQANIITKTQTMKIIVSICLLLPPYFVAAQFSKGQTYLGGTLSGYLTNSNTPATPANGNYGSSSKLSAFSISPVFGIFLKRNLSVGGGIGFSTQTQDFNENINGQVQYEKNYSNSVTANSFLRYYLPITSSFYFAMHGQINFLRGNNKSVSFYGSNSSNNQTGNNPFYSIGASLRPVFIFFPSNRWGIEAGLGSIAYTNQKSLDDSGSSLNSISISANSFSFGLAYYFGKKAK